MVLKTLYSLIIKIADGSLTASLASMCIQTPHQLDTTLTSCSKIWPESAGRCSSPRRVLDSSDAFYDSDDSPGLSDYMGLTRSLSRRALVSCSSSLNGEDDIFQNRKPYNCLNIWSGRGRVCRSLTFPSSRQSKRALVYTHCKSLGNSFKSYMNSLWIAKPLKRGCSAITSIVLAARPCKIFTYEEISKATNTFSPGQ